MAVVIEDSVEAAATQGAVFAYLHDPRLRGSWDSSADAATIEGEAAAVGARLHVQGHRMAPSWTGQYTAFEPPRLSRLRLVEGRGMPFRSYSQTITVAPARGGRSLVTIRIEYVATGVARLLEPVTLRSRLRKVTARSLHRIREHFA